MTQHLDLANLHEMTGGDTDVEKQLFRMFLDSAEVCLAALWDGCQSGKEDLWRQQSHALKGSAFNLGAAPLGEICKEAQDSAKAAPEQKQALLAAMRDELGHVRGELEKLISATS